MPYTQMPQRKCSYLIDRLYTWSESTSIALELSFLEIEGSIVPPVLSLSLSLLGTPTAMS
jgi:hypothetical protein